MHRAALLAADLVALLVFSAVGASFHGVGVDGGLVARTFLPLALSWLAVASLTGTYREASWRALVRTWIFAVPAGILLRQLLLGRLTSPGTPTFLLVGTISSGLLLVLVRLAVTRLLRSP